MNRNFDSNVTQMTISTADFPELVGIAVGESVSGNWTGRVASVDGKNVTITYDEFNVESENPADREFYKMSGKKKVEPREEDEDEGDY